MNEEIEYAEMLEIPVSTVNVVRKNRRKRKQKHVENQSVSTANDYETPSNEPLKDTVLAQVNDRLQSDTNEGEFTDSFSEGGSLNFDTVPERIDTVRLYSTDETNGLYDGSLHPYDYPLYNENEENHEFHEESRLAKRLRIALSAEFAAACVLCGAIFLTNVFMPNSAINTFFRSIGSTTAQTTDTRTYSDFTLAPVVSTLSQTELNLSPTGILSFTDETCVYSLADGTIAEVMQDSNGFYTVKLTYSDTFSGVINGLNYVYYTEGDTVKRNVPLGYSNGEGEVQVMMYSQGMLLNCFELTEENCLAWVEASES